MTHPAESDPLPTALRSVEAELADRLEEACRATRVSDESTGELMRLEETLLDAARAAKQAVSVRRKLRARRETQREARAAAASDAGPTAPGVRRVGAPAAAATPEVPSAPTPVAAAADATVETPADVAVRNLVDPSGVEWQIWEVTPSTDLRIGTLHDEYRDGWLAFESVDGQLHRRLPNFPRDWTRHTNLQLEALLASAEEVRRKPRSRGASQQQPEA